MIYTPQTVLMERFELIEKIGQGGMGQVWKAFDKELREEVALKMLSTEFASDPICMRQLKDEVKRGRKLGHPHIIRLYDLFSVDSDTVFITMELVSGKNVNHLRAQQEEMYFTEEHVLPWLRQISSALDYAHQQKVIHRDIKPSNILITEEGQAKLADFGIAVAMSDSMTRMTRNTSGTPAYMSPEQIQGKSLTAQSDLYSLGCTFFELLCGKAPYASGTADTVIRQHLEGALPDPSKWPTNLSPIMTALLQALLQRNPEDRPFSAGAVIKFLDGDRNALAARETPPLPPDYKQGAQESAPKAKQHDSDLLAPNQFIGNGLKIAALSLVVLLLVGLGIFGLLALRGFSSVTNDEVFTKQKFDADYSAWKTGLEGLKTKGPWADASAQIQPAKLSLKEKLFDLPTEKTIQSALERRLPEGVTLVALTPIELNKTQTGTAITYQVQLTTAAPLSIVPLVSYEPPVASSAQFKRLSKYLIFEEKLPAGYVYKTAGIKEISQAGQTLSVPWKVRKAVRDGMTWKVLDAEPLLLEANTSFDLRSLKDQKVGAQTIRSSAELLGASERITQVEQNFRERFKTLDSEAASYRSEIMVNAPPKPLFNSKAGDGGMATNVGVGTVAGAAAGAGIGALAGGGDGAALGAGIGAGAGLFGGLIKGSVEKSNRKNAYQLQFERRMAEWRSQTQKLEAQAAAHRDKLFLGLETELQEKAAQHNKQLVTTPFD